MKAFVYAPGDTLAGLPAVTITIEDLPEPDEWRESNRAELMNCFSNILDCGGVDVTFEDECADCHSTEGHRRDCPSNTPNSESM